MQQKTTSAVKASEWFSNWNISIKCCSILGEFFSAELREKSFIFSKEASAKSLSSSILPVNPVAPKMIAVFFIEYVSIKIGFDCAQPDIKDIKFVGCTMKCPFAK